MSNASALSSSSARKFGLPVLAGIATLVSPPIGAVLWVFALKQIANRQTDPSKKKLALVGMIAVATVAFLYISVAVFLVATGYDLFP
jgi:uncharacterized membrane protein